MEPNKWGLIRQRDFDLFALPILSLIDNLSEYSIEEIPAEYQDGYRINETLSSLSTSNWGSCVSSLDVSAYDYVLAPNVNPKSSAYGTGLNSGNGDYTKYKVSVNLQATADVPAVLAYALFTVSDSFNHLHVNSMKGYHLPIYGLRRRSDNVNPKGLTNADSKSLQLAKADKLNQEADRIRDGVSGDVKEPVLDSLAGDRTATSGDGEADS